MKRKVISSENDYQKALLRIEDLMSAKEGTVEFKELKSLAALVEQYEEKTCPIGLPSPAAAKELRMEQQSTNPPAPESELIA